MARTPEQIAADEHLREAVNAQLNAYGRGDGVIVDLVVLGSQQRFDEEGLPTFDTFAMHTEERVSLTRLMGLCEYGKSYYAAALNEG